MPTEVALLESRALRDDHLGRVDVLDKVKALVMLPDGMHVSTEGAARYFEVSTEVVKKVTQRHRDELLANGMLVLRGPDLRKYHRDMLSLWGSTPGESYPQAATQLALLTRRTILNIAMLLRDSDIARCVCTYLLDAEEAQRTTAVAMPEIDRRFDSLEDRVARLETGMALVGPALQELGPVLHRMSVRLESLDQRLDATNRVVGAMSVRLGDLADDVEEIKQQLPVVPLPRRRRRRR